MQIIHIPYCLDHILGYTTLKIVGPTYICKLKVLIVFSRVMFWVMVNLFKMLDFFSSLNLLPKRYEKVNLIRTWLVYIMISSSLACSLFPGLWDRLKWLIFFNFSLNVRVIINSSVNSWNAKMIFVPFILSEQPVL